MQQHFIGKQITLKDLTDKNQQKKKKREALQRIIKKAKEKILRCDLNKKDTFQHVSLPSQTWLNRCESCWERACQDLLALTHILHYILGAKPQRWRCLISEVLREAGGWAFSAAVSEREEKDEIKAFHKAKHSDKQTFPTVTKEKFQETREGWSCQQ